jgi:hypothetical protein
LRAQGLGFLLYDWVLVWMVLISAVAFICRFRRIAGALLLPPALIWFAYPLVTALSSTLPLWVQVLVYFVLALLILQTVIKFVFGPEVAANTIGQLLANGILYIFRFAWLLPTSLRRTASGVAHFFPRSSTDNLPATVDIGQSPASTGEMLKSKTQPLRGGVPVTSTTGQNTPPIELEGVPPTAPRDAATPVQGPSHEPESR